jgi:hypothetical protein
MSKLVFICSPYGGLAENILLAQRFMRMAAGLKYTPVAPHVMLHGAMNDKIPEHRAAGLELSVEYLIPVCWEFWLCGDTPARGGNTISPGMAIEKAAAEEAGIRVVEKTIDQLLIWERLQTHPNRFMLYHDWQWGDDPVRLAVRYGLQTPAEVKQLLWHMLEVGEISILRDRCV